MLNVSKFLGTAEISRLYYLDLQYKFMKWFASLKEMFVVVSDTLWIYFFIDNVSFVLKFEVMVLFNFSFTCLLKEKRLIGWYQ